MVCKHDWYDDYKAYSRMNAGRTNGRSGGDDWGNSPHDFTAVAWNANFLSWYRHPRFDSNGPLGILRATTQ